MGLSPTIIKTVNEWTPARAIEEMDRNDIRTAVTSISNPGAWIGTVEQGRRLSRICNEFGAKMGRDYPGRFGLFAAIPLPDIEGSLTESRMLSTHSKLTVSGCSLAIVKNGSPIRHSPLCFRSSIGARPRFSCTHLRRVAAKTLFPGVPAAIIDYPIDTTRAIMQWIVTKAQATYPDIKVVLHMPEV